MKKLLCFFILGVLICSIPFISGGAKLQAQTMPKIYYEQSFIDNNSNTVVNEVFTNEENTKKELEANGYNLNKEDNIYSKTISLDEYNLKNQTKNLNSKNLTNVFNEIFELQNQIFAKMQEFVNEYSISKLPLNDSKNNELNINSQENPDSSTENKNIVENKSDDINKQKPDNNANEEATLFENNNTIVNHATNDLSTSKTIN